MTGPLNVTAISITKIAETEADTERLGATLAAALRPGTVVGLVGQLGSGKTRFVQAIAVALGVDRRDVTSPTFVLIQEYDGRLPIYHFDAYRLANPDDWLEIGALELLGSRGLCLIEWADRVLNMLPDDHLEIAIEITGPVSRRFQFTAIGPDSKSILDEFLLRLERGQQRFG